MARADADRTKEIQDVATQAFCRLGYHGASMRQIGDAAGMNKGNIYYYFENKEELLFKILCSVISEMVAGLRTITQGKQRAGTKLRLAVEHHIWFSINRKEVLSVLVQETRHLSEGNRNQIHAIEAEYKNLLQQIVQEGVQSGEFRELDANLVTLAIIGMCNWMYVWYSPVGRRSPEEISGEFVQLITDPIARPPVE